MADYYPVLARAIAALDDNTSEARDAVYQRARTAIVKQLRSYEPRLPESEVTREVLGLEDAIKRVEAEQRGAGLGAKPRGFEIINEAIGDADALGRATKEAQKRATDDKATLEGQPPSAPVPPQRVEPRFDERARPSEAAERPVPESRPMAEPRPATPPRKGLAGDPSEPAGRTRRAPAVFAVVAVALLAALGLGIYAARDRLTGTGTGIAEPSDAPAKIEDRITADLESQQQAAQDAEPVEPQPTEPIPGEPAPTPGAEPGPTTGPAPTPPATTAPQEQSSPAVAPVAQRAVLYEESPDQQAGTAVPGTSVWRLVTVDNGAGQEPQIRGEIDIPNRNIKLVLLISRNADTTLAASHTIDMQFTLPPDFSNGDIRSIPGVLFKATSEAGGSPLLGFSAKVMRGFFAVGLKNDPESVATNNRLMTEGAWIDLPLLYDNGRRAVLTIELGTPGQQAFDEALAAWSAKATPAAAPGSGTPDSNTPR
jgi:hypothetical protein